MNGRTATPLLKDAQARATRFGFDAGGETGWHVHDMDQVG